MSQPRADRVDVDTGAKKVDGGSMAHGMRADTLVAQRRHGLAGFFRGPHDESMNAITSDRSAVDIDEDRRFAGTVEL